MKVYGLTGNIGTGKSTIAKMFEKLGAFIVDADKVAREIVEPGKPAWDEIVNHFGEKVLNKNNSLDRKKLGDIVFNDKEDRKKLNEITHPEIIENIKKKISESTSETTIIEAALLEKGGSLKDILNGIIVVSADPEVQVERIKNRDGISNKEAEARISSQLSNNDKIKNADFIIINNSDLTAVQKQVESIWRSIN